MGLGGTYLLSSNDQELKIQAGTSVVVITEDKVTLDGQSVSKLHPLWVSPIPRDHALYKKAYEMAVSYMEEHT